LFKDAKPIALFALGMVALYMPAIFLPMPVALQFYFVCLLMALAWVAMLKQTIAQLSAKTQKLTEEIKNVR